MHYIICLEIKQNIEDSSGCFSGEDWLLNDEWDVEIRNDLSKYSIFSDQDQVFLAVDSLRVCSISGYLK